MRKQVTRKKIYRKLAGICKGVLFAAGIVTGGLTGLLWRMEAMAAEMIEVTEFGVVREGEGIYAKCAYRNFDGSSGMMQLYLEKMDEEGDFLPIGYADLFVAGEETQAACTQMQKAEPGIYRAVLLMRSGTGTPVVRFRDSAPFEVESADTGGGDVDAGSKEEGSSPEGADPKETPGEGRDMPEGDVCGHILVKSTVREATPFLDAVVEESCESCGQSFGRFEVPNSAYAAFLGQAARAIRAAEPQDVVTISTDRWVSFDRKVLAAMAERRDVSVLVKYRYKGQDRQVLVPAGAEIGSLADENGFCGFCYLTQVFGEMFDVT